MKRRAFAAATAAVSAAALVGLSGPANASGPAARALSDPPPPGPGGCSVDISGSQSPGVYSAADNVVSFGYTLGGQACADAIYALVVRNNDNPRQNALFLVTGRGIPVSDRGGEPAVGFKQRLPFVPTAAKGSVPGAGLCVIGVTFRAGRIQDVAPDQPSLSSALLNASFARVCQPLTVDGARAFH